MKWKVSSFGRKRDFPGCHTQAAEILPVAGGIIRTWGGAYLVQRPEQADEGDGIPDPAGS